MKSSIEGNTQATSNYIIEKQYDKNLGRIKIEIIKVKIPINSNDKRNFKIE